jgi:hypothetical protein
MATTYNNPITRIPDSGLRLTNFQEIIYGMINHNVSSAAYNITAAGTNQATAYQLNSVINEIDTAAAGTGVALPYTKGLSKTTPFQTCYVINNGANALNVYPANGTSDAINPTTSSGTVVVVPAGGTTLFVSARPYYWESLGSFGNTINLAYNTNSATSAATLTAANVTGGINETVLNMTGTLAAGATATTPTAALWLAAIPNAYVGYSYVLRIINSSSANFAWTVGLGSGVTNPNTSTLTIAQNTWREFLVNVTNVTSGSQAMTITSIGTGTNS